MLSKRAHKLEPSAFIFVSVSSPIFFYHLSRCLFILVLQSANLKFRDVIVKLKADFCLFGWAEVKLTVGLITFRPSLV